MSKKSNSFPTKQKLSLIKIILISITLLFAGLLLLSYSNFYPPFVGKQYIFALDNFVGSIPFIPKTPKQIVTRSLYPDKKLSSYKAEGKVVLKGNSRDQISLVFSGKVNKAAQFGSESSQNVKGQVTGELRGEIDFQTVESNENFYFRTLGNLGIEDFDPTLLGQDWYQIDRDKFQASLGVEIKKDAEIAIDIAEQAKKLQNDVVGENIFSKLRESKIVNIKNQNYFQYKFTVSEKILNGANPLSGYSLKQPVLTLLINKKTFYLEKWQIDAEVVAKNNTGQKEKMSLKIEYQIFEINKKQKIEIPKNNKTISHPVELSLAFDGKDEGDNEALLAATEKAIDRGQNFLTIERILKVTLLLPKAIYPE